MARVDKTESAVGVTRALLAVDIESTEYDKVLGVSLDSSGHVVVGGGGQTGIVGVVIPNKFNSTAGRPIDIFKLGEIVEAEGLAAGTDYYFDADGELTAVADDGEAEPTANVYAGFTVEADRLVLAARGSGGSGSAVLESIALTAVPGSFADVAAVRTYLLTLVAELKTSAAFE